MSKIVAGVDEAGRGPVLGPLVIVALAIKEEDLKKLEWLGVKDSKLLSAEVREELFEQIRQVVHDFRIEVIEPEAIDLAVKGPSNLNWLEADTSARLVADLNPDKVIIDCPSTNILNYTNYFKNKVKGHVKEEMKIVMEHKADVNHLIVAAASIIAKVIRDKHVDNIKSKIGIDFGSGYLTDPKTQEFLNNHYQDYSYLFRKSWESYRRVICKKNQSNLGDF